MEQIRFTGPNSWKLNGRIWRSSDPTAKTIVGVHGYSEHSGRYAHFARFLNENSFHAAFVDLPGQGLSEGRRANIDHFDDYILSLESFLEELDRLSLRPTYTLFGHSLGGLVCARFLEVSRYADLFDRALFTSPLFGLSHETFHHVGALVQSKFGLKIFETLMHLLPNITIPNSGDLGGGVLTHDRKSLQDRASDSLITPAVTIHWVREFLKTLRKTFRDADRIRIPLGIFQAGDDRVVSAMASKKFFDCLTLREKVFRLYPGLWHEILNEVEKERVMDDMLQWIKGDAQLLSATAL